MLSLTASTIRLWYNAELCVPAQNKTWQLVALHASQFYAALDRLQQLSAPLDPSVCKGTSKLSESFCSFKVVNSAICETRKDNEAVVCNLTTSATATTHARS